MKLSEALMLGSTTGCQMDNMSWETCLIGVAVSALVKTEWARPEAEKRWPWLLNPITNLPKEVPGMFRENGFLVATYLCDRVLDGTITLDKAADIIRQIEPAEEPVSPPQTTESVEAICTKEQ